MSEGMSAPGGARVQVLCGDVRNLPDIGRFHAILCDPPYELGFMNKSWDASGVAYDAEMWRGLLALLHPGGFGMAFGSSRTYHRLACAIEDAGAVLHPMIYGWGFGSGFPKATRIDTQVDRRKGGSGTTLAVVAYLRQRRDELGLSNKDIDAAFGFNGMAGHWTGFSQPEIPRLAYWPKVKELLQLDNRFDEAIEAAEREVVGRQTKGSSPLPGNHDGSWVDGQQDGAFDITLPATPLASVWSGHRYGKQALKPAVEPICCFQRPYEGKPWECITETGAGAMWIDGARVGTCKNVPASRSKKDQGACYGKYQPDPDGAGGFDANLGRWPANLVLCHEPGCNGTCEDGCAVRKLGEQSGDQVGGRWGKHNGQHPDSMFWGKGETRTDDIANGCGAFVGDSGTAARFFTQVGWQLEQAEALHYCAKASRRERDAGLEEMAAHHVGTYAQDKWSREHMGNTPDAERDPVHNVHPTVKPIALARHLATLLLPPPEYAPRRILIPFAGTMSEAIGAVLAGWEEVVAIEVSPEYCEMGKDRLDWWRARMLEIGSSDPRAILETCGTKDRERQGYEAHSLF